MDDRRFRVVVLGAGFSRLAGFPLGPGLWTEVLACLDADLGQDNYVRGDLESFRAYKRDVSGQELAVEEVDFEEFISFLDAEHYLGLRGSDTWSREGNESQLALRWCIGKVLCTRLAALETLPVPYLRFAESLRPSDIVLTFNYDSLLERSLDLTSRPYRLFPDRYSHLGITKAKRRSSSSSCTDRRTGSIAPRMTNAWRLPRAPRQPQGPITRREILSSAHTESWNQFRWLTVPVRRTIP